jgi:hypothetical protein
MKYTIQIVGMKTQRTLDADSAADAAEAFGKSVALPQDGWVCIVSEDGTHKQYPIRKGMVDCSQPEAQSKTELAIEESGYAIVIRIMAFFVFVIGWILTVFSGSPFFFIIGIPTAIVIGSISKMLSNLHENKQRLMDIQNQLNALRLDQSKYRLGE